MQQDSSFLFHGDSTSEVLGYGIVVEDTPSELS